MSSVHTAVPGDRPAPESHKMLSGSRLSFSVRKASKHVLTYHKSEENTKILTVSLAWSLGGAVRDPKWW